MKRNNHTILLVEDDPNDQFFFITALRSIGVTSPVHVVCSSTEAIAYLRGEGKFSDRGSFPFPSYIVTDLKMPGGSGFEVLQLCREEPVVSQFLPVIVFSSSSDSRDIKRSYELGAKSFIVKPPSLDELKAVLKTFYEYWSLCEVPEPEKPRVKRVVP
jgi:CheY-like chemotaxis protein